MKEWEAVLEAVKAEHEGRGLLPFRRAQNRRISRKHAVFQWAAAGYPMPEDPDALVDGLVATVTRAAAVLRAADSEPL